MVNNMLPPRSGERVELVCLKCKNRFIGKLVIHGFFGVFSYGGSKCPKCGSKKVMKDPFIFYNQMSKN